VEWLSKKKQGHVHGRKTEQRMICTGTFLEDLIASVERAEVQSAEAYEFSAVEALVAESAIVESIAVFPETVEPWLVSAIESPEFDSKLLGVA
jgi:hypothetical protein